MKYQAKIDLANKSNSHTLAFDKVQSIAFGRKLKVLEVGCSSGYFGSALMQAGHEVWGVEPNEKAITEARNNLYKVHHGLIEDFYSLHSEEKFDAIVFGDVLEHLTDPISVLCQSRNFLNSGGIVVASIPNVAHVAIRAMMLEGSWQYSELGILDKTHLRFFTRESILDLFTESIYKVTSISSVKLAASEVIKLCNLDVQIASIDVVNQNATDFRGDDFQYVISAVSAETAKEAKLVNEAQKLTTGLRVLCLSQDPNSSITKIRLSEPLNRWANDFGGSVKIVNLFECTNEQLNWADIVVFQREVNNFCVQLAKKLQVNGKKVVYEIDDLLTDLPPFLNHHAPALRQYLPSIISLLKTSDAVSTTTVELRDRLIQYNSNIFITPNYSESQSIFAKHFEVKPSKVALVIASSDKVLIDMLIEPLLAVQKEFNARVVAIGPPAEKLESEGIRVEKYPTCTHFEFKSFISSLDNGIGLIPLDSSVFSSCKTAVKYFDYSACGIPSICSNVKPYSVVIEHGITGLLVENTNVAWTEAIQALLESSEQRQILAAQAHGKIRAVHSLENNSKAWQVLFSSLISSPTCKSNKKINYIKLRRDYKVVLKTVLHKSLQPSSYYKAFMIVKKKGLRGLANQILRR